MNQNPPDNTPSPRSVDQRQACSAGWQTMATAPRDGTRFVALKYGTHPTTAYWNESAQPPKFVFENLDLDPSALTHWIALPNDQGEAQPPATKL